MSWGGGRQGPRGHHSHQVARDGAGGGGGGGGGAAAAAVAAAADADAGAVDAQAVPRVFAHGLT
jgi:hypothetical protein